MAGGVALMGNTFGSWVLLALLVAVVAMMWVSAINDYRMLQAMRDTLRELVERNKATDRAMNSLLEHVGLLDEEEPEPPEREVCQRMSGTLAEHHTERFEAYRPGRHR